VSLETGSSSGPRLEIPRKFSSPDIHPFDQIEWETRTAEITDESGKVVFKQTDVEVPKFWSDMATKVVVSKYFYGEQGTPQREKSVKALIARVCETIAGEGYRQGYFDEPSAKVFSDELTWLCVNQYAAFNSPVWFNVGLWNVYGAGKDSAAGGYYWTDSGEVAKTKTQYEKPQCSACFIQRVEDNMESIMQLAANEAMLFKFGSGTGTDLSSIRSSREKLSGGGRPSGPMSFLRIYDQVANVVKSGGKTRRAAKMNTLKHWHGDIEEFITAKMEEEKKAWALIEQGYSGDFNGPAYGSVMFQNENLSVRVDDDFMGRATGGPQGSKYYTKAVTDGHSLEEKDASKLLDLIAEGTWTCGDPGIQFDGVIQKWHTCKASGKINSTNPCSEFVFLDDTACNLASINLMKFRLGTKVFDYERFKSAVQLIITAQDILVDMSSYPTHDIAVNSHNFRPLGLGYANLGALLMSWGLPYDSDIGRGIAADITSVMTGTAYAQSALIADVKGAFTAYTENAHSMLGVIDRHHFATYGHAGVSTHAVSAWIGAHTLGKKYGYRNAQVTVLAPTGTIAFLMDCDTTGIEPDIALVKYKNLAGGGSMKIVNQSVKLALQTLGYSAKDIDTFEQFIENHDTIESTDGEPAPGMKPEHLPVFDCAFKPAKGQRSIAWDAHLKMMAAVQPFISGAISKTINMENSATVADIRKAYIEAWKLGLKCVAIYRDGSKRSQPLNVKKSSPATGATKPQRTRMPETRQAITHKFEIAGHEGYLTVGFFDDGTAGELFVQMAKEGSTIGGLMDTIGTLTSIALQYGVPLETLVEKFSYQRFEPSGYTKNKDIKQATSVIDYVFRWMRTLQRYQPIIETKLSTPTAEPPSTLNKATAHFQQDAPACPKCGHIVVRNGSCYKCYNCGESLGCS
jgi:ribonucleoside-diphosphate reductase alpha chain